MEQISYIQNYLNDEEEVLKKYVNCWTADNQQICINGNGKFYEKENNKYKTDSTIFSIKDSIIQGKYIRYIDYGKGVVKAEEGIYVNGLRQGPVIFFDKMERISFISNYEGYWAVGLTKYVNCWTANNKQICINGNGEFYKNEVHGFKTDSTIYSIKDSIMQGKYIRYIDFGKGIVKYEEGTYVNGLRQGAVAFFDEMGRTIATHIYINDRLDGLFQRFYNNGKLKEEGYSKDAIAYGTWMCYTDKGILEKKIVYENNKQKYLTEFYPNGKIKSEGNIMQLYSTTPDKTGSRTSHRIAKNVKHGLWRNFDSNGKLTKEVSYFKGKLKK